MADYADKVSAFDSLFTTNHIQMLKILLSAVNPALQKQLAVYIKLLELQYTLTFFRNHPYASLPLREGDSGISSLLEELFPLCTPEEKEKMQNIRNFCQNWENMQEMLHIMEMLKEISPELFAPNTPVGDDAAGDGSAPSDKNDLFSMLSGFGGMDLAQMTELLQSMFS